MYIQSRLFGWGSDKSKYLFYLFTSAKKNHLSKEIMRKTVTLSTRAAFALVKLCKHPDQFRAMIGLCLLFFS